MKPDIPIGINLLKGNTVVKKTAGLGKIRRGKEILFIEKESASWMVLSGPELRFFNSLDRPATITDIKYREPLTLTPRQKEELILDLFKRNMVSLNGIFFYNTAAIWKTPQQYPAFLCFHITAACNFNCKYCYAKADMTNAREKEMPKEVTHKAIEKIIDEIPLNKFLIDFHGGEPFVAFDRMVDTIKYAREYNKKRGANKELGFIVQSNGSLVTPEQVKILRELDCNVGFSLDGPDFVHDEQRIYPDGSGTFDRIWKNFEEIRKQVKYKPGLLAVIHKPEYYEKVFDFFLSKGIRSFRMNYSAYIGRAVEELEFPHGRAETFAKYYLEMLDKAVDYVRTTGKPLFIRDIDNQLNNILTKNRPFMCYRSPCGCGNSILGFGKEGGIYACEEATGNDEFLLGNIFDGTSLADVVDHSPKLKEISARTVDNIPKCRECLFKRFCGGRCTTKSYARFGSLMREDPMCRFYQIVYPELMWKIHDNPDFVSKLNPNLKMFDKPDVKARKTPPERGSSNLFNDEAARPKE